LSWGGGGGGGGRNKSKERGRGSAKNRCRPRSKTERNAEPTEKPTKSWEKKVSGREAERLKEKRRLLGKICSRVRQNGALVGMGGRQASRLNCDPGRHRWGQARKKEKERTRNQTLFLTLHRAILHSAQTHWSPQTQHPNFKKIQRSRKSLRKLQERELPQTRSRTLRRVPTRVRKEKPKRSYRASLNNLFSKCALSFSSNPPRNRLKSRERQEI